MKLEEIRKGVIRKRKKKIKKLRRSHAKKIWESSRKPEVSLLVSVNASGLNPGPIGIRAVAGSGVNLTVTVNGARNRVRVTVRITASERLQDLDQDTRGQAKNIFLTRALAPPHSHLLALSSSCHHLLFSK